MPIANAISEHDVVSFLEEVRGWSAGTVGTVVSNHGETVLVEITGESGKALDFVQAPVSKLTLKR